MVLLMHQTILCVLERIQKKKKKIMTIGDKVRDQKLKYDNNREAAKISVLLSGKIDKYKYLTGKQMFLSGQSRMIEQPKFTYSPLEKLSKKKQTKKLKVKEEMEEIDVIVNYKERQMGLINSDNNVSLKENERK